MFGVPPILTHAHVLPWAQTAQAAFVQVQNMFNKKGWHKCLYIYIYHPLHSC